MKIMHIKLQKRIYTDNFEMFILIHGVLWSIQLSSYIYAIT